MSPMTTTFVKFKEGKAPEGFDPKYSYPVIAIDPGLDDDGEDATDFFLADKTGNFMRIPMSDLVRVSPPDKGHHNIPAHKRFNG